MVSDVGVEVLGVLGSELLDADAPAVGVRVVMSVRTEAQAEIELDRVAAEIVGDEPDRSRRQLEGGPYGSDTDMPGQITPSMIRTGCDPAVLPARRRAFIDPGA